MEQLYELTMGFKMDSEMGLAVLIQGPRALSLYTTLNYKESCELRHHGISRWASQ
jgi:hypothetical protein